jgi:hypothetical protein
MTRFTDHLQSPFQFAVSRGPRVFVQCIVFNILKGGAEKCFPSACRNESNHKHVVPLRSDITVQTSGMLQSNTV